MNIQMLSHWVNNIINQRKIQIWYNKSTGNIAAAKGNIKYGRKFCTDGEIFNININNLSDGYEYSECGIPNNLSVNVMFGLIAYICDYNESYYYTINNQHILVREKDEVFFKNTPHSVLVTPANIYTFLSNDIKIIGRGGKTIFELQKPALKVTKDQLLLVLLEFDCQSIRTKAYDYYKENGDEVTIDEEDVALLIKKASFAQKVRFKNIGIDLELYA